MKKTMSFTKQIKLLKLVSGIAWIIAGTANCFDNLFCSVVAMVSMAISTVTLVRVGIAKKECSDEMADENLCIAKARTLDVMHLVFCIAAIVAILSIRTGLLIHLSTKLIIAAFFFMLGMEDLLVGLIFRKLEEA